MGSDLLTAAEAEFESVGRTNVSLQLSRNNNGTRRIYFRRKTKKELERRFWLEGADFYREHLADEFLMLFPGVGVMLRSEAIQGIEGGQRWTEVRIQDQHSLELGPESRLICYEAKARREDGEEYSALVSSVYMRRDGSWKLTFHQQSPVA